MSKVRFICVDPDDDACYRFEDGNDVSCFLYTDGRYGNVEGANPFFWERFYGASAIDVDRKIIEKKDVIVKINKLI